MLFKKVDESSCKEYPDITLCVIQTFAESERVLAFTDINRHLANRAKVYMEQILQYNLIG